MIQFSLAVLVLTFICIPTVTLADNGKKCLNSIQQSIAFTDLPPIWEADLPESIKRIIELKREQAQSSTFIKTTYEEFNPFKVANRQEIQIGDGSNIVIGISHLIENRINLGENLAARFVEKVLGLLYPKAIIEPLKYDGLDSQNVSIAESAYRRLTSTHYDKHLAYINIRDLNEKVQSFEQKPLEMSLIKPAVPGLAGIAHHSLRESLGIPKDHSVVSLYFKEPAGDKSHIREAPSMRMVSEVLSAAFQKAGKRPPDLIFATKGGSRQHNFRRDFDGLGEDYQYIALSEWKEKYQPGQKFIVENDLFGRMPQILNISDLAFVSGPINIMEPLTASTPLVFLNNPEVITDYDPNAFNNFADIAKRTGGGWEIENIDELEVTTMKALQITPNVIVPPFLLPINDPSTGEQLSPVDRLVNRLIELVAETAQRVENIRVESIERRVKDSKPKPKPINIDYHR